MLLTGGGTLLLGISVIVLNRVLHSGHKFVTAAQSAMHTAWNLWEQRSNVAEARSFSGSDRSSKQIAQGSGSVTGETTAEGEGIGAAATTTAEARTRGMMETEGSVT